MVLRRVFILVLWLVLVPASLSMAQSGKISGIVRSSATGEALPGVNVVVLGTTQGAVTDLEGYYHIIQLRPGTYALRVSFLGYGPKEVEGVFVRTGLTADLDISLEEEAINLGDVVVVAARPVVDPDVSANVATLTADRFESLPLASINEAIELEAGVEPNLQIRGAGNGQAGYLVDGMSMRTGRFQEPFSGLSLTAVEQVQVQTGGFNAEYGDIRSGLISVTTKEPPRTHYTFDGLYQLRPAQAKRFDGLPEDPNGYYVRPWRDPEVAFEGTRNWDPYTRRQYPTFEGWNSVAARLQGRGFDISPDELLGLDAYYKRKSHKIDSPDYTVDATLAGPFFPGGGLGRRLGDPRFLLSYRGTETMYSHPDARPGYSSGSLQFKMTANLNPSMRVTLVGMQSRERGINAFLAPFATMWKGNTPYYPWQTGVHPLELQWDPSLVWSNSQYNRVNYDHTLIGGEFTHAFNAKSFYEVRVHKLSTRYRSPLPNLRDDSFEDENGVFINSPWAAGGLPLSENALCFGGASDLNNDGRLTPYCVGQEPFGFATRTVENVSGINIPSFAPTRDTTRVSVMTGRFDLTSQVNRFLQFKTGAEVVVSTFDMRYGFVDLRLFGPEPRVDIPWSGSMVESGFYTQAKLEFEGMIANLGVRLDYVDPVADWWVIENPYDRAFAGSQDDLDASLTKQQIDAQVFVSPRFGVSFPITTSSKLYFNYGHFRQRTDVRTLFGFEQSRSGGIEILGNPTLPLTNTVAYELGYDQELFGSFLLRISGFYRDIRNQYRFVEYSGLGDLVNYFTFEPWNYEDVRGAEFTLSKRTGEWIEGFINYTFLQTKTGDFGYARFYENQIEQRDYLRNSVDFRSFAPTATPYARLGVTAKTPHRMGRMMGDWRVNMTGEWRDGQQFFWDGQFVTEFRQEQSIPELKENVSWRDYWMFDLRIAKYVDVPHARIQFFVDVSNVFNLRHLNRTSGFAFFGDDQSLYMKSLHLPGDVFDGIRGTPPYLNIPGSDQPGDFRKPGTDFQPIEAVPDLMTVVPNELAWYWSSETSTFHQWRDGQWEDVPESELKQAMKTKAYIDMPNFHYNAFFNPRSVSLGLRVSF